MKATVRIGHVRVTSSQQIDAAQFRRQIAAALRGTLAAQPQGWRKVNLARVRLEAGRCGTAELCERIAAAVVNAGRRP